MFLKLVCSLIIILVFVSWLWFILDIISIEIRKKREKNEHNNKIK